MNLGLLPFELVELLLHLSDVFLDVKHFLDEQAFLLEFGFDLLSLHSFLFELALEQCILLLGFLELLEDLIDFKAILMLLWLLYSAGVEGIVVARQRIACNVRVI